MMPGMGFGKLLFGDRPVSALQKNDHAQRVFTGGPRIVARHCGFYPALGAGAPWVLKPPFDSKIRWIHNPGCSAERFGG
jgi:hypothetical protein